MKGSVGQLGLELKHQKLQQQMLPAECQGGDSMVGISKQQDLASPRTLPTVPQGKLLPDGRDQVGQPLLPPHVDPDRPSNSSAGTQGLLVVRLCCRQPAVLKFVFRPQSSVSLPEKRSCAT